LYEERECIHLWIASVFFFLLLLFFFCSNLIFRPHFQAKPASAESVAKDEAEGAKEAIADDDEFLAEFDKSVPLEPDHRLLLDCCLPLLHSRSSAVCAELGFVVMCLFGFGFGVCLCFILPRDCGFGFVIYLFIYWFRFWFCVRFVLVYYFDLLGCDGCD
jgi:hypothetical protein